MQLTSTDVQAGQPLSSKLTCDGENTSPNLSWVEAPEQTKSFVLVLHDPDASQEGGFLHWSIYNIPGQISEIPSNIPKAEILSGLGLQGLNGSGELGYTGPCPPSGIHRYFFHLYALKEELELKPGASYAQLQDAMKEHILDHAELMALYGRPS